MSYFLDGRNIKNSNGTCIAVKGKEIADVQCSRNDLSHRWLYTGVGQILNMKTLKCLQWNNDLKQLTTAQCKASDETQRWTRKMNEEITLDSKRLTAKPLYFNSSTFWSYRGKSLIITIQLFKGSDSLG